MKERYVLLVVGDSEQEMPWSDPPLLVLLRSVPSELKDFSNEVFEDRSKVHYVY